MIRRLIGHFPIIKTSLNYFQGPWLVALNWGFIMLVKPRLQKCICSHYIGYYYRGGSRGRVQGVHILPPPPTEMSCSFLIRLVFRKKKKTMTVVYWCWSRARDECTPSYKKSWIRPCIICWHKNHTIGLLFTDTKGAFGVTSVMEQSCEAMISAWCWMCVNKLLKSCCCSYHTRQLDNNLFWVWLSPTSIMKCM